MAHLLLQSSSILSHWSQGVTSNLSTLSSLRGAATSYSHSCGGWLTPGRKTLHYIGWMWPGEGYSCESCYPTLPPIRKSTDFFFPISPCKSSVSEAKQSITLSTQIGLIKFKVKVSTDSFFSHKMRGLDQIISKGLSSSHV